MVVGGVLLRSTTVQPRLHTSPFRARHDQNVDGTVVVMVWVGSASFHAYHGGPSVVVAAPSVLAIQKVNSYDSHDSQLMMMWVMIVVAVDEGRTCLLHQGVWVYRRYKER